MKWVPKWQWYCSRMDAFNSCHSMYLPTCVRLSGGRSALRPILRNPEVDRSPAEPFYPSGSKAGAEYRVPLPLEAVKLLKKLPRLTGTELLFPGTKGQALPDMIMTVVMRRMKADAVPHGFRSIFRDWAGEKPISPESWLSRHWLTLCKIK